LLAMLVVEFYQGLVEGLLDLALHESFSSSWMNLTEDSLHPLMLVQGP
jgi:hypothetical protein